MTGTADVVASGKVDHHAPRSARSASTPCPPSARLQVEDGQPVHAGDQLTEGSKNPQDILRIQGREAVQRYLVDEVQKVYRSQGVNINDKHIEIIVRQMLRKVRVDQPGDTELLPGELVDRFEYEDNEPPGAGRGRRAGDGAAGAAGRDQGLAEHRELPGGGVLPGDDPRADRGGDLRARSTSCSA